MASVISILISARARTGAAFAQARADLARLTATVRLSARRWIASVIARGGLGAVIAANLRTAMAHVRAFASRMPASIRAGVARAIASLGRLGRSVGRLAGQFVSLAGNVISTFGPMAAMAAKVILIAGAVATLSGVLGNLLGITQLIAPAIIAGGAAMAVFKMSLNGVGDALKAGMDGDVEKLNEALKKLSPNAKSAVLTMLDLRKEWKSTQRTVQDRFFAGFREDIIAVSRAIQPVADRWLPKMADAFGAARFALRTVLEQSANSGQLDKIMAGVTGFFQNLALVVEPVAKAFLNVAEVAAPKFEALGKVIADLAKSFRDWIQGAKDSGKLQEWLDKAWETAGKLWTILKNLGGIIAGIFRGSSDEGDSFLDSLIRWTQSLSDWINSGDGQEFVGMMASIIGWLGQMSPLIGVVVKWLTLLTQFWGFMAEAGKAAWEGILAAAKFVIMWILNGYGMLVNGAAKAFGWMPGIGDKLKAAAASFNKFRDDVNNSLNGIQKTVDITVNYRARYIGNHLVSGSQQSGTYSSGIGGRAAGGNATGVIMAGERGPELIDVGAAGAHVNNAGATRKILAGQGGTGGQGGVMTLEASPQAGRNWLVAAFMDAVRFGHIRMRIDRTGRVVVA